MGLRGRNWFRAVLWLGGAGLVLVAALLGLAAGVIYPGLPPLDRLQDYKPKIPLRIYSSEGILIGEFGEERRAFVGIDAVPKKMEQAIIAAEDERFYTHNGIDPIGVLRALRANFLHGSRQGASTITMQVARNFYLTKEQTLSRKASEALLALKIERNLSKRKILELYLNHIYLGQRAYGFEAAARTYFGKGLKELSLGEIAMLAGLPKAPSAYNPVANPKRAAARQKYVLERMVKLGFVKKEEAAAAISEKLAIAEQKEEFELEARHAAEMVRGQLARRLSEEELYGGGYKVTTTIRRESQEAATQALRDGVMAYEERHGYRGPEGVAPLPQDKQAWRDAAIERLKSVPTVGGLIPAIATEMKAGKLAAILPGGEVAEIWGDGLDFARGWLRKEKGIQPGAIIRVRNANGRWRIAQVPQVEAALVAVNPQDGAIEALAGGVDFGKSQFNYATQAWRQPGSSFKPFIYSAALEKGIMPSTLLEDAPISLSAEEAGGEAWEPKNYDEGYSGLVSMRSALTRSLNMVSIRLLKIIGIDFAREHAERFGFSMEKHPAYLSMALGAGAVTPLELAAGYAVFANGGLKVEPKLISRIEGPDGKILFERDPKAERQMAFRAIDERNAFLMTSMMRDVVRGGTAAKARELGRKDIAGKTGTTNDQKDAWFAGFSPEISAVAWIGFSQPRSLGAEETGGRAALPIWMEFMRKLPMPKQEGGFPVPPGIASAMVDPESGEPLPKELGGKLDFFYEEHPPGQGNSFLGVFPMPEEEPVLDASGEIPLMDGAIPSGGASPEPSGMPSLGGSNSF